MFYLYIKQQVCQKEEERGHKLLQPLAGLFVSNNNRDIRIELSALEPGWKIKGSKVKVTKQILEILSSQKSYDKVEFKSHITPWVMSGNHEKQKMFPFVSV